MSGFIGLGDAAPAGLSYEMWLTYHPEFTSKITGYTSGGMPIYQGVSQAVQAAEIAAWSAYNAGPQYPASQLANSGAPPSAAPAAPASDGSPSGGSSSDTAPAPAPSFDFSGSNFGLPNWALLLGGGGLVLWLFGGARRA